jgi:putative endonuclease
MKPDQSEFIVYVLRSTVDHKRYIGYTSDLDRRLKEHNSGHTKSTKLRAPFVVSYQETVSSLIEARARERYFKTGAGRRFLSSIGK